MLTVLIGIVIIVGILAACGTLLKGKDQEIADQKQKIEILGQKVNALNRNALQAKSYAAISKQDTENLKKQIAAYRDRIETILEAHQISIAYGQRQRKAVEKLGKRLFSDSQKNISVNLTPNNYTASKKRLEAVLKFCSKNGYAMPEDEERDLFSQLKADFETVVRRDIQKQEQARIKALIREEQRLEREREREIKRLASEQAAVEKALQKALREAKDEHDVEVERLRALLQEAEEKSQRAKSQAQLTKAGHVYVISNLGSFGEDVFKIGMTRRLEPMDRVKELGDASVPFPFDVHMMISCQNAPSLENNLHRALHQHRVNKVNLRKEYFQVPFENILALVKEHHGEIDFVAEPEAFEFHESQAMGDDDFAFVSEHIMAGEDGERRTLME